MKDAAGEANKTVIVVVLIGVVVAIGLFIIPKLMRRVNARSCCHELGGRLRRCADVSMGFMCCHWNYGIQSNGIKSAFESCVENYK